MSCLWDWKLFTIEPTKHTFYYFRKGVLPMTPNEMFDRLAAENKEIVTREIENLIKSQSEHQSPSCSQE